MLRPSKSTGSDFTPFAFSHERVDSRARQNHTLLLQSQLSSKEATTYAAATILSGKRAEYLGRFEEQVNLFEPIMQFVQNQQPLIIGIAVSGYQFSI